MKHSQEFINNQLKVLTQLRDSILHNHLQSDLLDHSEEAMSSSSSDDVGSAASNIDITMGLIDISRDNLYDINEAIHRIKLGTYGICESTGELIPEERLQAIPWARMTIKAQISAEKSRSKVNPYTTFSEEEEESYD
jgi:RNA polymerase-binding transcription factor DksA